MASKTPKLDCRKETETAEEPERGNWDGLPPELLNMIFNHLPVADLLSCSVVSKTWKKASRDVLKRSRECYAYIKDFPQDVHDLIDKIASTDLMQMVNGLHIQMRAKDNNENESTPGQEFHCSQAVNIFTWKETTRKLINVTLSCQMRYLSLDMQDEWEEDLSTYEGLLMRELITVTSASIQKLIIWQDHGLFLFSYAKEFSKLKVVQMQFKELSGESFLKDFLTAFAPNLEEIIGGTVVVTLNEQNPFMLKRSKSLVVYHVEMSPKVVMKDYRYISGLHRLDLQVCHCDSFAGDNILFSMVLNSSSTLEELRMYTLEFYNLFKTSTPLKFPNLRRLTLATNWNMPLGNEIAILKQLNLPKLRPNLVQFELSIDEGEIPDDAFNEKDCTSAALPSGTDQSDLPLQIEFDYRGFHYSHEYFEFLNVIYNQINKVHMLNWELGDSISEMNSLFSGVHSLEYLEINASYCCPHALDFQMDALLCGISMEEADFIFNIPPRTNVELIPFIVPTRPSLFNAKSV